jgi:cysteine-S-conjugate beta-lyase
MILQAPDRRATDSAKWTRHARAGRDVLPFWVADMDFVSPPAIIDALRDRVNHGVFGYADAPASCLEAVLEMLAMRHGIEVSEDWIVWLPGLVPGLAVAAACAGIPGDGVLIQPPVYPPFFSCPLSAGRKVQAAPLEFDEETGRFGPSVDKLEAACTPETRMLLLCNPHNPVGRVFNEKELDAICQFCANRNVIMCSDEIHCDLILDQHKPHRTATSREGQNGLRTITLHAPSKTYNIAGLGLSFAVIPDPELRAAFRRAKAGFVPDPNVLSYAAAEAAYRHGGEWLGALLGQLRANRDRLFEGIGALPGLRPFAVEATYLMWIDARGLGVENPQRWLLEHADVFLSDGADFGAPGFVRFNFGCAPETLEEGLCRIASAIATAR